MSLTLVPKFDKSPNYNQAGWDMCAIVNMVGGAPVYFVGGTSTDDDFWKYPCIPETVTRSEALKWGLRLEHRLLGSGSAAKLRFLKFKQLCAGLTDRKTDKSLREFVQEWASFLQTCGGYKLV